MKLTLWTKLKLCLEILIASSGNIQTAQEKQLSTFQRGNAKGLLEGRLDFDGYTYNERN